MGRLLLLEPFDIAEPVATDAPPSPDWLAGHESGMAEGQALSDARQRVLRDDVTQALLDLSFTYAEARTQVLSSLTTLFTTVMDRLLPGLAEQALVPLVVERILDAAQVDSAAPMRIAVHPSALAGLTDSLPTGIPLPVSLEADAAIPVGQVLLLHKSQETTLDVDGLLHAVLSVLAALFDETERKIQNG